MGGVYRGIYNPTSINIHTPVPVYPPWDTSLDTGSPLGGKREYFMEYPEDMEPRGNRNPGKFPLYSPGSRWSQPARGVLP